MTSMFTPDIARQIVSDRLREAEGRRRARRFTGRRTSSQAGSAGSGTTERVVRREKRRPGLFTGDIVGAS